MKVKANKIMLADGFPTLPDFDAMETGEATKEDVYATQDIIAHVQKTLKADKAYTSGESFIYNGVLYHATDSIAKDANIVLTGESANATTSNVIQTQIDNISNKILSSDFVNIKDYITISDAAKFGIPSDSYACLFGIKNGIKFIKLNFIVKANVALSTSFVSVYTISSDLFSIPALGMDNNFDYAGLVYSNSSSSVVGKFNLRRAFSKNTFQVAFDTSYTYTDVRTYSTAIMPIYH